MNVTALVHMLLSCHVLFRDGRSPTSVKTTSFQLSPTEGITVHEWTNSTEGEVKKIKFNETDFNRVRIQMTEKDGKVVLGGQVTKQENTLYTNCPVVGDMEQLSLVLSKRDCTNPNCFYRMKDMVYMFNVKAGQQCTVFASNGTQLWETVFLRQPDISCSSPLGQSPNEDVSVFTVNGECKQINHSVLNTTWTPTPCADHKIDLEPNVYSKFYHLRYLMALSGCGQNMTDTNVIDNTYVKFLHKPTEPPPTAKLDADGEKFWVKYMGYIIGGGVALTVALIVCIALCIVFRKKIKKCCKGGKSKRSFPKKKKKKKKKKPQVILQYKEEAALAEPFLYDYLEKEEIRKLHPEHPIRAEEQIKKWEEKKEQRRQEIRKNDDILRKENEPTAKVGEKLKTFKLGQNLLATPEVVYDAQTNMKVPQVFLHYTEPYNYSKLLGAGSLGKVFTYKSESTHSLAVKIVDGNGMKEAEKEIQLMGEIQSKFGQLPNVYLMEVYEVGQFPDFLYIMMPMYCRTMEFFMPGNRLFDESSDIAHRICVAWEYLKGIQQLHSLGYGHNDISPRNFMQHSPGSRSIVLINFGLVKRLGTERRIQEGTYLFMSLTAYDLEDTSIMDDYQSWLFIVTFMLRGKYEWTQIQGRNDLVLADLDKKKRNFFNKLQPSYDRATVDRLLDKLAELILRSDDPVDPEKLVKLMEKESLALDVNIRMFEWREIDFEK